MFSTSPGSSSRLRRGKAFFAVTAIVALLAVGGFAAYKYLFNRPGEAATFLIPGDADLVITLDTNPSQRQVTVFKQITDALQNKGIAKKLDDNLKGFLEGKPMGEEIRPHLQRSFAMGMWMKEGGKEPEVVTLCSIDDPAAVRASLEKYGQKGSDGNVSIPGTENKMMGAVVDRYLVLSNSTFVLDRITKHPDSPIAQKPEFVEARAALPEDANLMVFVSPKVFESFGKAFSGGKPSMGGMSASKWMAYGATIVPEGIAFDYQCPMDPAKMPALKAMAGIAPFDLDTLRSLPEGAYGVFGYSQGGKYWDVFKQNLDQEEGIRPEFEKGIAQFEKETGLSVANDIVPALQGEQVVAVYPGASGKAEDVDVVLMLTGSNNANPASLATKLRALIERKSAEEKKPVHFTQSQVNGATVWEIDSKSREELFKGVGNTIAPRPTTYPANERPFQNGQLTPPTSLPPVPTSSEPPTFLKEKTILYAEVDGGILITSSHGMLEKALLTKSSGRSLATDVAYAKMQDNLVPGSQTLLMVNIKRIMDTLKPTIDKNLKGAPIQAVDLEGLFGDGLVGIVASGKYDGNMVKGRMLLPLDFEKGIAMIGDSMKADQHAAAQAP